jgi:hypothetical protein
MAISHPSGVIGYPYGYPDGFPHGYSKALKLNPEYWEANKSFSKIIS